MKPAPEIRGTARPIRIAFIVEDGEGVHTWLDAAFAEAFGRHGGRQSLIVPVVNGAIPASYLRWLKAYDPDAAFVVTSNNEQTAAILDRDCSPVFIDAVTRHRKGNEHLVPRFKLRQQALSSLSWLPFLKVSSGGWRARPEVILDCYPRWEDDGLITDNFGTLYHSFDQFPLHRVLGDLVRPLMLTPKDAPEDRWKLGVNNADEVKDRNSALDWLSKSGRVIALSYLSNLYSKHVEVRDHPWTNSFCLVIGDTFEDRVSCWNAGLLFDDAQQQAYKTLRLPSATMQDPETVEQIKRFLNSNNWINRYGSQPQVTLRSFSLDEEQLKLCANQLGGNGSWATFHVERISSLEDGCPLAPKDRRSPWLPPRRVDDAEVRIPLRHRSEAAPIPQPMQLKHAASAHPICFDGQWIAQFTVDRTDDNNRFDNMRDAWALPKRNQLTQLFLGNIDARITSGGSLAVPVDRAVDRVQINEPEDDAFFHSLLHESPAYSYPDIRYREHLDMPYRYSRPSDKGRYLQGVLGMFGSLHRAYDVLTHGFWRKQFSRLGNPSEDQYPHLVRVLQKRFPPNAGRYTFERDEQWEKLARTMVNQAMNVRQPKYTLKLRKLQEDWKQHLERAIETDPNLQKRKDQLLAEAPDEATRSLENLCQEGVFHQGYSWVCRHCAYRNWTALDGLRRSLECQVCHEPHGTPADLEFDFRMNEFLATCLREHDTLSVIWALGKLSRDLNSSLVFAPQTELFRKWPEDQNNVADRELDIVCVLDGKVVFGEVKASLAEIDKEEIDNLVNAAGDLRPDGVVIGAMEGAQAKLDAKLDDVRMRLAVGIEVRGLLGKTGEKLEFHLP